MGELAVPATAYYGVQTARALENFPISSLRFPRAMIRAMGLIKRAAATVNQSLGLLDKKSAEAIKQAATEVVEGKLDAEFPVDIFQTGSGTSTNMNTNEVISNRATELLGGVRGSKLVHPNDHVNLGQSSNDVIPTAIHIAAGEMMQQQLIPALTRLHNALARKANEFDKIVKIGRTHLQDATPVRLGQEFGGYARQIELGIQRVKHAQEALSEVALGGTAVGTGLNCHPKFPAKVMAIVSKETGCTFTEATNHFEAQSTQDSLVEASGELKTIAVSLMKIANDIRWLGSGPRCGLGEITLPETQPGSSIMPGKVNPVIAESVTMVCAQVIGNDVTVTVGGQAANFELIVMLPVMAYNLFQSIELLSTASTNFADQVYRRHQSQRGALQELDRGKSGHVHGPGAGDRLRSGRETRQRRLPVRQDRAPDGQRTTRPPREAAHRTARPLAHDRTGRAGGQRRGIEGRVRASFQNPALLQSVAPYS